MSSHRQLSGCALHWMIANKYHDGSMAHGGLWGGPHCKWGRFTDWNICNIHGDHTATTMPNFIHFLLRLIDLQKKKTNFYRKVVWVCYDTGKPNSIFSFIHGQHWAFCIFDPLDLLTTIPEENGFAADLQSVHYSRDWQRMLLFE